MVYQLDDNSYAAALDSMWIEELTTETLYDSITEMVQDQDLSEVEYAELPTDTLKKRLAHLSAITPFNLEYNPYLERVIKSYLKRHRPTMERLMGLSQFYFPGFEETLDKYNLPLELKYLAIVESALRPRVRSRAGATGMWQFMYATAKIHDLKINSYVDERMDPVRSTEAASEYLARLYEMFDDWDLALASYNSGPGNVSKAIRRSGGHKNYWNLRPYLPRETAGYVPAFFAFMYIFEYANEHGYHPEPPPFNYFLTDTVHIKETISLEKVSEFTGVSLAELEYLNPVYKLNIIPKTQDDQYALRLPRKEVGKFVYNEDAIYATVMAEEDKHEKTLPELLEQAAGINYRVKSGDFLGRIAERYSVGISQIKQWNNLRSNKLRIGQRLLIYPNKTSGR
ncbi:MAG TPA: LysM peptidoglycan-binding domain-containing protein [Leeuwenhoekiella sp.]|nr:LysM peptidoglycan-binding domain-containing protein [Leeuwenhoekiella sp.]